MTCTFNDHGDHHGDENGDNDDKLLGMYSFCRLGTDCKPSVVRILFLLDIFSNAVNFFPVIVFPTTPQVELLDTAKVLDSGHFPDEVAGEVENLQLRQLLQTGDGADPEV